MLNRFAIFIDGSNIWATARNLGMQVDYAKLLTLLEKIVEGELVRAYYYTAIHEDPQRRNKGLHDLLTWLEFNGYTVVKKYTKIFIDEETGKEKIKGNMDMEIAVHAMELATCPNPINKIVLFTGDGDFTTLVEALQRKGVRVMVVSTIRTQPPMIADELRRQADVFKDLADWKTHVNPSNNEAFYGRR